MIKEIHDVSDADGLREYLKGLQLTDDKSNRVISDVHAIDTLAFIITKEELYNGYIEELIDVCTPAQVTMLIKALTASETSVSQRSALVDIIRSVALNKFILGEDAKSQTLALEKKYFNEIYAEFLLERLKSDSNVKTSVGLTQTPQKLRRSARLATLMKNSPLKPKKGKTGDAAAARRSRGYEITIPDIRLNWLQIII